MIDWTNTAAVGHRVAAAALFCVLVWSPPVGAVELGPGGDLCAAMNALAPGAELVLEPGDYQGPCTIRRGGTAGAPILIRAADPEHRPRIVYTGDTANVLAVQASHVRIRGLTFGPTQGGVDTIRIFGGTDISVEQCLFSGVGGIAVVANSASVTRLAVVRNVIERSGSTGMYFGCHDGIRCGVSGLRVEGNFIREVRAVDPEIGYGLEVKLNSSGIIRDNVIVDTKGPGIMVYGSRDLLASSLVERNFVMGSHTSSGIVVGGGPVVVRNNISVGNAEGGIGLEDYGRRGLLRGVVVAHNTLYRNIAAGIFVPGDTVQDATLMNNAAQARAGTPAFPKSQPGLRQAGNIDCTWAPCFAEPDRLDFSPLLGSLLSTPGSARSEAWSPADDYFRTRRAPLPIPGAVERQAGSVTLGPKP
jgi:Right handed beta helix region